jgi:hypothetical protein
MGIKGAPATSEKRCKWCVTLVAANSPHRGRCLVHQAGQQRAQVLVLNAGDTRPELLLARTLIAASYAQRGRVQLANE